MIAFQQIHFHYLMYDIRNRNMKLTKENVQLLDDYYIEFMQEEYDNILSSSKRTDIDELVNTFNSSKDVVVHIMVETDREAEQIAEKCAKSVFRITVYSINGAKRATGSGFLYCRRRYAVESLRIL